MQVQFYNIQIIISTMSAWMTQNITQLNSDLIRIAFIETESVSQYTQDLIVGSYVATIVPDYSTVKGNILGSTLVAFGADGYESGILSNKIVLGSIARSESKISKIVIFTNVMRTIRTRIAVFYTQ